MIDNILIGWRDEGSGIETRKNKDLLKIIPNPLIDKSRVVCTSTGTDADFSIYDLYGKLLFTRNLRSEKPIILNREDFTPGVYFWKMGPDGEINQSGKLVVY